MFREPTGRSLLIRDPPVRGRDTFGSPGGSVVRTIFRFELGCVWGPRQIASSNSLRVRTRVDLDPQVIGNTNSPVGDGGACRFSSAAQQVGQATRRTPPRSWQPPPARV